MVQVISTLGSISGSSGVVTITRPILVSLGFGIILPITCRFAVLPLTHWLSSHQTTASTSMLSRLLSKEETALIVHTLILLGMVTGASYAGTSNLFAAYLTGAAISWWDSEMPRNGSSKVVTIPKPPEKSRDLTAHVADTILKDEITPALPSTTSPSDVTSSDRTELRPISTSSKASFKDKKKVEETSGTAIFDKYYHQLHQRLLKPFFFASIGFSIPITRMFTRRIIWRGLVYTSLMIVGKLMCGLWLIRLGAPQKNQEYSYESPNRNSHPNALSPQHKRQAENEGPKSAKVTQPTPRQANISAKRDTKIHQSLQTARPISIYPGAIVGCAMVARGEIGFLISSLAEAQGVFGDEAGESLFLIVTWAILLCTFIGPVGVGVLVRRLKRLSEGRSHGEGRDVLVGWGLTQGD